MVKTFEEVLRGNIELMKENESLFTQITDNYASDFWANRTTVSNYRKNIDNYRKLISNIEGLLRIKVY